MACAYLTRQDEEGVSVTVQPGSKAVGSAHFRIIFLSMLESN